MGPPARKRMAVEAMVATSTGSNINSASTALSKTPAAFSGAMMSLPPTALTSSNANPSTSGDSSNTYMKTSLYVQRWITTLQILQELNEFCRNTANFTGTVGTTSLSTIMVPPPPKTIEEEPGQMQQLMELQLQVCRKLRELLLLGIVTSTSSTLPNNMYLCFNILHTIQVHQWIPMLLTWLAVYDTPVIQVEALLALTGIAELLCTTETPPNPGSMGVPSNNSANNNANTSAASRAKTITRKSLGLSLNHYQNSILAATMGTTTLTNSNSNMAAPVPYPPLSFSQTMSPEAFAAFDASMAMTIQENRHLFNPSPNSINALSTSTSLPVSDGNNTALTNPIAPYMPPNATPVIPQLSGGASSFPSTTTASFPSVATSFFPQPLSAKAQNILLRHHDAIPTLIVLLSTPNTMVAVAEQAVWIIGSIAAGDGSPPTFHMSGTPNSYPLPFMSSGNSNSSISHHLTSDGGRGGSNSHSNSGPFSTDKNGNPTNAANSSNNVIPSARDFLLASGVMNPILLCLEAHPTSLTLQRIGSWTLSILLDNIFQQPIGPSNAGSNNNNSVPSLPSAASALTGSAASAILSATNGSASTAAAAAAALSMHQQQQLGLPFGPSSKNGGFNPGEYSSADAIDMDLLLPVLYRLLHMTDADVLSYICWCLSYLCDGPASHIAAVVTTPPDRLSKKHPVGGLVPRLVELLLHPSWRVTKPALRTIGNIVCAECPDDGVGSGSGNMNNNSAVTTDYTEVILDCNAVPRLKELITHSNREIQKEAAWTLSNIAAGTIDQIQAVIDSGAIPPLVNLVRDKNTDQEVRSEACWVVLNATSCGSDSQIELLVDEGCVSVLGVLLSEPSMVMMALEGLERVLQVEETREMIRKEQIENGEIEDDETNRTPVLVSASLIELARESHHNSSAVTKRADKIWKQHFVYCALCRESFSKHRTADASFCEECKCHVCKSCNCEIYHLDYQEELWAATEEQTEAKKNAKKSKNKKKKAKLKEKKASTKVVPDEAVSSKTRNAKSQESKELDPVVIFEYSSLAGSEKGKGLIEISNMEQGKPKISLTDSHSDLVEDEDDNSSHNMNSHNQIDFVLYLQQTGSIIALSKLMDALEFGGEDYDDELDDFERKMIREQQLMRGQATN
jgi:Armadillo/beta-catenin-like repeat